MSTTHVNVSLELLQDLVDSGDCEFDHNHSCQAHGYFYLAQGAKCPQFALKEIVLAAGGQIR